MNVFEFIIIVVAIGCVFSLAMRKLAIRGGERSRYTQEETELVQEIYRGMARLEKRVEALETLLMDTGNQGAATRGRATSTEGDRP